MKFIDLFCGIGSFHQALKGHECVLACDTDPMCRETYSINYEAQYVAGDVREITRVPQADIVCAGPPCVSFSTIGKKEGLNCANGDLINQVFRIVRLANPQLVVLENVRNILNFPEVVRLIYDTMSAMGFTVEHRTMNCKDYGIPQSRIRVFFICRKDATHPLEIEQRPTPTLGEFLGLNIVRPHSLTIRTTGRYSPITDEKHNWSHYRLMDGTVYRLTLDDCAKLQGFSTFYLCGSQKRQFKMLGNTIPTCLTKAVIGAALKHLRVSPQMSPLVPV